jgi:tRNA-dihydrouridine synthase A
MLDLTDPHCRVFYRKLSRHAWLYSEMITTGALIYGKNLPRFLDHDVSELPVALQLGGSDPNELAHCAKLAQDWGYQAVNLNVGCPSDRVQNNMMGACLMAHPARVADCVKAMKDAVNISVTVKHRIGIDNQNSFEILQDFVSALTSSQVDGVIIHARKAWLQGLSPKENRDVPPLNYGWVHQIKQSFPDLDVMINGGIASPQAGLVHLAPYENLPAVDGVMLGRAIYDQPYLLAEVDAIYHQDFHSIPSRFEVVESLFTYIEAHLSKPHGRLSHITRHMMGLFHGQPGGRLWRRHLSEQAGKPQAGLEILAEAMQLVKNEMNRMELQNAIS